MYCCTRRHVVDKNNLRFQHLWVQILSAYFTIKYLNSAEDPIMQYQIHTSNFTQYFNLQPISRDTSTKKYQLPIHLNLGRVLPESINLKRQDRFAVIHFYCRGGELNTAGCCSTLPTKPPLCRSVLRVRFCYVYKS